MSLTKDLPSTPSDLDEAAAAATPGRQLAVLPRSPSEALVPLRPPEAPREPPEHDEHPVLNTFDALFSFFVLLACLVLVAFFFVKVQFDRPGPLATSTVLVVPRGEGVTAIADRLQQEGIIADRRIFMTSILYFMYLKGQGTLKAGEYQFDKHATMRQVLDILVEGKSVEHKVTLPEGLTSMQIVDRLRAQRDLAGEVDDTPPEGSLLPDTYSFGTHDSRKDIIERMQLAQRKFMEKVWADRDPDIVVSTPEEALILASIVEKETGRADERPHIASVFINRLKKHMRLQSDPTIIYGLVGGKGALDHPITQEELDRDTPYNTYKINGLPPTPIGNPGRASIEAVLNPAKTKDLYFCANGTGGHAFAPTLEEHNKNVAKWRQIEQEMAAKKAQEDAVAAAAAANAEANAAADPAVPSGSLQSPEALVDPAQATATTADGIPLPLRNPKR
jgi:UPF0755 protein